MKFFRAIYLLLPLFCASILFAADDEQPKKFPIRPKFEAPTDFYLFVGLGSQIALADKVAQWLATQAVAPDTQERRAELINEYYKKEITKACKVKREDLQKQIEKAIKAVENAEELEKEKKTHELLKLQFDFHITTNYCSILLDPEQRAAYEKRLSAIAAQTDIVYKKILQRVDQTWMFAPSRKILLSYLIEKILTDLIRDVPGPALKIFNQNMELRNISALPMPPGPDVRYGIGFSGLMAFNNSEVRVSVYVIQDIYGDRRASISVDLPEHYKLSDLIPSITILDTFSLPKAKLILADFEGFDLDGFHFKKGFNYAAVVDLKGPLAALNALKDQSKYFKSVVFEGKPIIVSGLINTSDIAKTSFSIAVPLYFGIDLQQLSFMPSMISKVINKITTDELNLTVLPFKKEIVSTILPAFKFRIKAEAGARIVLGTQKDPIRLTLNGLVEPPSVNHRSGYLSFGGNLKNMFELDWLAIGNATIQLDIDPALTAITGYAVPFTGLLMGGQIDLGKPGDTRAQLKIAGGFRVRTEKNEKELAKRIEKNEGFSSAGQFFVETVAQARQQIAEKLPEVLFDVEATNIQFADLLSYTTKLAAKTGIIKQQIPVTSFPSMTLHKVWGHLALVDTRIADKEYKAGLGLQVETEFWQQKAGFRIRILVPEMPKEKADKRAFQLSGWGYMPPITISSDGKELFRLHGVSEDKGPRLAFFFNPQEPHKGSFVVNAALSIPSLGLKQVIDFKWYYWWLVADFESKFAGFSVVFGIRMNVKAKPPQDELAKLAILAEQEERKESKEEEGQEKQMVASYTEFEKWRQLYIKFGFKDDFAEFLNAQLVPALRSFKTQILERLDKLSTVIAQQQERGTAAMAQEIAKTEEEIAVLKKEIVTLKAACRQRSRLQQISCQASIAAQQAKLQTKIFYRTALLRPTKAIVRGTTQLAQRIAQARAWRLATEAILEGVSKGIEFLAAGIKLLRVKEAVGEYSYRDMINRKLPRLVRLVLELNLTEEPMQLVLENLQFDFKAPKRSGAEIIFKVIESYSRSKNAKYLSATPMP